MALTIALWSVVALFAGISFVLWLRRPKTSTLSSDAPLEDQILAVAKTLGVDAAAQRFSVPIKTVRRLKVLHGLEPRSCATCEYFDLAKGQAAIASNPNMWKLTQALSPAKISHDDTNNQSWLDFGACLVQTGTIIGATDWCGREKIVKGEIQKSEDLWA